MNNKIKLILHQFDGFLLVKYITQIAHANLIKIFL